MRGQWWGVGVEEGVGGARWVEYRAGGGLWRLFAHVRALEMRMLGDRKGEFSEILLYKSSIIRSQARVRPETVKACPVGPVTPRTPTP